MTRNIAFVYPPSAGNTEAYVIYYAVFLVVQICLAPRYLRGWNWPIFLGLCIFLVLEILGSVAYLKLHYAPLTGAWYNLWLFALTAAPTFLISSLHLWVRRGLQTIRSVETIRSSLHPLSRGYLNTCFALDLLALILTIIGTAYAGAKASSNSPAMSKPGFDIILSAMAVQLCSLVALLIAEAYSILSFRRVQQSEDSRPESTGAVAPNMASPKGPSSSRLFHANLFFIGLLVLARTIVRAVALAGGLDGPIQGYVLVNVEAILLFVAILFATALHPTLSFPGTLHHKYGA